MPKIYSSMEELIGGTPLLELSHLEKEYSLHAKILAKLESFNPAGSAKDRVALAMIEDAEERGILAPGAVIIEPTSGNTGIGLAAVASVKGYRAIIVMPDTMSVERQMLMKAFGAEVVLTEGAKGMAGSIEKAKELAAQFENSFIPDQFGNPANAKAHYQTTGPEIWADTDGKIDYFIAGIGTGGTISGVGRYLKEKKSEISIIGVEPAASPLLSEGKAGPHPLQGIGANFVPDVLDREIYDELLTIEGEEAFAAARALGKKEGILAGISSGAALAAAIKVAKREECAGKTIVALLPDTGDRYLSTALFKEE